jgi:protein-disulfide isomerase
VLHQLAEQYMDKGKAKVVYMHFAFIGDESQWAAQASECANEQNQFWPYANYVFAHQTGENVGAFSRNNLKQFAVAVGLDATAFNACFDGGQYDTLVRRDTALGRQRGVNATPTFFINGKKTEGLLSAGQMAALIDALLPK